MIYLGNKAVDILRMAEAADDQDEYVKRQILATERWREKPIMRKSQELRERGYLARDSKRFEGYRLTEKGEAALREHVGDPTENPIVISDQDLGIMAKEAGDCYPEECCGVIVVKEISYAATRQSGKCSTGQVAMAKVVPCLNVQTDLHRMNPKLWPRDGRRAYAIHPEELRTIKRDYLDNGWVLRAIYHSHVETPPTFSKDDVEKALHDGKPLFPGVDYLVMGISIKDPLPENVSYTAGYRWSPVARQFLPVKVQVDAVPAPAAL